MAEADQDRAGQRRKIDDRRRLVVALDVGDRVGKHEPAFGVGVDDLDRLARHGGDDVARPLGIAARHVLDQPADADDVGLGLAQRERLKAPTTAPAPPMSHFIASMPAAGLIEMPPVSKVTPLPTKASRRPPCCRRSSLQDQQPRFAHRALGDAEQRTHSELLHRRPVEHFELDAGHSATAGRVRRTSRDK